MFRLAILLFVLGKTLGTPVLDSPNGRIVGGHNTTIELYPYQVSLQYEDQHFCGAFLIASDWVLTAAYCITQYYDINLSIRAGSSDHSSGGQLLSVSKIVLHDKWNLTNGMDNNIAALQLSAPVTISSAGIGKLPKAGATIAEDAIITVTGWGATENSDEDSDIIQVAEIPFVSYGKCIWDYEPEFLTTNMFCAGLLLERGKGECYRDAGGPAAVDNVIVGVYSWGHECVLGAHPGIYIKISQYRDWINQTCGV